MRRGLLLAVLLVVAAAIPAIAALDGESRGAADEAREFRGYRVFWLGERFGSQELTNASREESRKDGTTFTFIYGDCEAESDSGCAPPYQLQNYSACERNLATRGGPRPKRRKPIRGAAVYRFGDGGTFDMLEVYTGRTTIVVFAPTEAEARRVVRRLESTNVKLGPDDPLGPPARGAVRGKLRCG
jgi:hypothetical protein